MVIEKKPRMTNFSEAEFEHKLLHLKDTHDSISNLSNWCLNKYEHHGKIVSTWLNVLKGVKVEHRLRLFYLANDVIQYSKRKGLPYVDAFAPALQKATTMVRDDAVKNKILRLFKIWDERGIYDEGFLVDLSSLLSHNHKNTNGIDLQDFQPSIMYSKIRACKELEDDTDLKLKLLNDNHVSFTDVDKLRNLLKDRTHGDDVITDFDEGVKHVRQYINALEAEVKERHCLIDLLDIGEQHYSKEFKEAKVVVNAYKCFANRVRLVKRKLEEQIETMPSPIPSPDVNAPSPSPEPKDASSEGEECNKSYYEPGNNHHDQPNSNKIPEPKRSSEYNLFKVSDSLGGSSPNVYVPAQVPKTSFSLDDHSKSSDEFFPRPNKLNALATSNFYSQTIVESTPTTPAVETKSNYLSKDSRDSFFSHPETPQSRYYGRPNPADDLYSPTVIKPPNVKQDFYNPLTSNDNNLYMTPEKLSGNYFEKSENDLYTPSIKLHSEYSPYRRDDYSRSSNDDMRYSPTEKLLPDNFVQDASFSKTPFAETLKDFYLSSNNSSPPPKIKQEQTSDSSKEGSNIELVSSVSGEKMTLSALLQTLIPPENSKTLLTIEPEDPSGLRTLLPTIEAKPPPWIEHVNDWDTPESPPLFEKSAFPTGFDDQSQSQDIDMRFFKDVDHRNLISLTNTDSPDWAGNNDADYRTRSSNVVPPVIDDVENVDMEMSDDEENHKGDPGNLSAPHSKRNDLLDIPVQNVASRLNNQPNNTSFGKKQLLDNLNLNQPPPPPLPPVPPPYITQDKNRALLNIIPVSLTKNLSDRSESPAGGGTQPSGGSAFPPGPTSQPAGATAGSNMQHLLPPLPPPPPPLPPPVQTQQGLGWNNRSPQPTFTPPLLPTQSQPLPPDQHRPYQQRLPDHQNRPYNHRPAVYFGRPPPPLPRPPHLIQQRQFRPNFRPFHRGPPRFPRW